MNTKEWFMSKLSLLLRKRNRGLLSLAGNSVITKKDQELADEESRLIEEYYRNYKAPKPHKSRLGIPKRSRVRAGNRNVDEMSSPGSRESFSMPQKQYKKGAQTYNKDVQELDEDERVSLIAKLERRKQDLWTQIQHLPVCNRSVAVVQREKDLYRQLDEVSAQAHLLNSRKIYISQA